MEWIKSEDELPKDRQRVLVFAKSRTREPHVTVCTFYQETYENMRKRNALTPRYWWSRKVTNVTHWMPLPGKPLEES